jgi:nucleotide-binding universal stress UspA family protein
MERILLVPNVEEPQPWVADAAAELARDTGAEVVVLAVDDVESQRFAPLPRERYVEDARRVAGDVVARLDAAGVPATQHVRSGNVLDEVLAFADEVDADAIVVGPSVRGRMASALLGNVVLRLVQRATRPVIVVTRDSAAG